MLAIKVFVCWVSICLSNVVLQTAQKPQVGDLRGQVYADRLGVPFPDAKVEAYLHDKLVGTAISDRFGQYRIENLNPGHYKLITLIPGARTSRESIEVKTGKQHLLNIGVRVGSVHGVQPSPLSLSGVITTSNKKPLIDVTVTAVSPFDTKVLAVTETDANGKYSLRVDYGEQFILIASKPGFLASSTNTYPDGKADFEMRELVLRK
jgi:hypothetical protein